MFGLVSLFLVSDKWMRECECLCCWFLCVVCKILFLFLLVCVYPRFCVLTVVFVYFLVYMCAWFVCAVVNKFASSYWCSYEVLFMYICLFLLLRVFICAFCSMFVFVSHCFGALFVVLFLCDFV